jgi:monoamine oxidase
LELVKNFQEEASSIEWKNQHMKIVVIGAGISGITAARELKALGYDVSIVEARDRIGGRIHTIVTPELKDGCGIDIGAAFIHGIKGNPITNICNALVTRFE